MSEIKKAIDYWKEFKQEAIDMIENRADVNNCLKEQIPMCDLVIQALQEKQEREQKWIPVSERLPENNDIYLATFEEFGRRYVERFYYSTTSSWYMPVTWQDEGRINEIIAWQPLPTPYKEATK